MCNRKRVDGAIEATLESIIKEELSNNGFDENVCMKLVVEKLMRLKEEHYTTYVKNQSIIEEKYNREIKERKEKRISEYEGFKEKFGNLNYREVTLLKQGFKLLSHKHHPDKGGDTETMAVINEKKHKLSRFITL